MHQILDGVHSLVSSLGEVAGDLGTPGRIGRPIGHTVDKALPGVQIDEEQHVSVFKRTDSTVKRPQAMIKAAWARMN